MIDFGRATEIDIDFLREYGHPRPKLDTTVPVKDGWDFLFDVGAVSKKILIVRVNKEGKIIRLEPLSEIELAPPSPQKQKFIDNKGRLVAEMTKEEITEAILEIDDIGRKYALEVMPYKEAVSKLSKINPFNLAMAYISLLELYTKQVALSSGTKKQF